MPQIIVPEGYYTEEEMAIRLNKSVSTLKVFRSSKKSAIPPYVKIGRTILYKIESFQRWLDSKEQNNNNNHNNSPFKKNEKGRSWRSK